MFFHFCIQFSGLYNRIASPLIKTCTLPFLCINKRKRFLPLLVAAFFLSVGFGRGYAREEKVVLQLRWDHNFQFAGYYAAKWKGFYREEGLSVEIKGAVQEDGTIISPTNAVSTGRADFGIGAADILVAQDKGADLSILCVIFQKSPVEFYSLRKTRFSSPSDMVNLRVAVRKNDLTHIEMRAMLRAEGIFPDKIRTFPFRVEKGYLEDLMKGEVDVVPGYSIGTPYEAIKQGISLNRLNPATYGIDFYGDSLFTRKALVKKNPDLADRFISATRKGWEYAIENPQEIAAQLIQTYTPKYPVRDFPGFIRFQIAPVKELTLGSIISIGHVNPGRWEAMENHLKSLGIIHNHLDMDAMIYSPRENMRIQEEKIERKLVGFILICIIIAILSIAWIRTLQYRVEERTKGLSEINRKLTEEIQNREKKEIELKRHRDMVESLLENAPNPIVVIHPDHSIRYVNPATEHITGYSKDELIGIRPPFPWWPEKDVQENKKVFLKAFQTGVKKLEKKFLDKSKNPFWVEITSIPVYMQTGAKESDGRKGFYAHPLDEKEKPDSIKPADDKFTSIQKTGAADEGELQYYLANWTDITRRKVSEEKLQIVGDDLHRIIQSVPVGLWSAQEDASGYLRYRYISDGVSRISGYPVSFFREGTHKWQSLVHPDDAHFFDPLARDITEGKESKGELEYRIIRKDGSICWVYDRVNSRVIAGDKKRIDGVISDITEKKLQEKEAENLRKELQMILDAVPAMIFYKDKENRLVRVNKAYADATGLQKEEIEGRSAFDLVTDQELGMKYWEDDKEVMQTRKPKRNIVEPLITDTRRWYQTDKIPYLDDEGKVIGIVGFAVDITEIKKTQDALLESENRFSTFMDHFPGSAFMKDRDFRLIYVNTYMKNTFGNKNWLGSQMHDLFPDELADKLVADDEKAFSLGIQEITETINDIQGVPRTYRTIKFPIQREGKHTILGGISIDITRQINAEKELQKSHDELEQRVQSRTHELSLTNAKLKDLAERLKESEERYIRAEEIGHFGHWERNMKTREAKWSKGVFRIFGIYPDHEISYSDFLACVHPDDRHRILETEEVSRKTGKPIETEYRIFRENGDIRDIYSIAEPRVDETREIIKLTGIIQDITERKKTENQLQRSRVLLEKTLSSLMDAIFIIDEPARNIMDCNDAATRIFGYTREELIGNPPDFLHENPDTCAAFREMLHTCVQEKGYLSLPVFTMRKKDGTVFYSEHNVVPLESDERTHTGWVSVVRDISEKVKYEQELKESQAQLIQSQKMEALGTLVAGVAHEVNNPLNLIMFNIPLLLNVWRDFLPILDAHANGHPHQTYGGLPYDYLREKFSLLMEDMKLATNRIAKIVQNLKSVARQTDITEEKPVSLNQAVENAVKLSASTIKKADISIAVTKEDDLPPMTGNLQALEQILLNLILNAAEAVAPGKGMIHVETEYEKEKSGILLKVKDNGKGVEESLQARIFDPFVTGRKAEGGTGLGLSVTFNLVKALRGKIWFHTENEKGTTFYVFFPVKGEPEDGIHTQ